MPSRGGCALRPCRYQHSLERLRVATTGLQDNKRVFETTQSRERAGQIFTEALTIIIEELPDAPTLRDAMKAIKQGAGPGTDGDSNSGVPELASKVLFAIKHKDTVEATKNASFTPFTPAQPRDVTPHEGVHLPSVIEEAPAPLPCTADEAPVARARRGGVLLQEKKAPRRGGIASTL